MSSRKQRGYSLLELSVVIGILSLVGGSVLSLGNRQVSQSQQASLAERLDTIEAALSRYYLQRSALPCPASLTQAENTTAFGQSPAAGCTGTLPAGTSRSLPSSGVAGNDEVVQGAVPVRTLGLPDSYLYDGWGNRIQYAVIQKLTHSGMEAFSTTLTTGVIQLVDASNNQITRVSNLSYVPYVLWSSGPDKRGAYNRNGQMATAACVTTLDAENCNGDHIFRDMNISDTNVLTSFYHDIIRWRTQFPNNSATKTEQNLSKNFIPVRSINVGSDHSCALLIDGTVKCWGRNHLGQLGNGSTTDSAIPVSVSLLNSVTEIQASGNHSCALLEDTTVRCWGNNDKRQLGDNTGVPSRSSPVSVFGLSNAKQLANGFEHSCALLNNGTVSCWGSDNVGNVGDGTANPTEPVPRTVVTSAGLNPLTNVLSIGTGSYHTCAVLNTGILRCWGSNWMRQLNDGTVTPRAIPTTNSISVGQVATQFNGGLYHSCVLLNNGTMSCWGDNSEGQWGNGTIKAPPSNNGKHDNAAGLSGIEQIDAGTYNSCARVNGGIIRCWGINTSGELGNGTVSARSTSATTVNLPREAIDVEIGGFHGCAVLFNGTVYCWGGNNYGQAGKGVFTQIEPTPLLVRNLND
jgi:prepilin-type N-terminal cleavage/methylation domain-containing protein